MENVFILICSLPLTRLQPLLILIFPPKDPNNHDQVEVCSGSIQNQDSGILKHHKYEPLFPHQLLPQSIKHNYSLWSEKKLQVCFYPQLCFISCLQTSVYNTRDPAWLVILFSCMSTSRYFLDLWVNKIKDAIQPLNYKNINCQLAVRGGGQR